ILFRRAKAAAARGRGGTRRVAIQHNDDAAADVQVLVVVARRIIVAVAGKYNLAAQQGEVIVGPRRGEEILVERESLATHRKRCVFQRILVDGIRQLIMVPIAGLKTHGFEMILDIVGDFVLAFGRGLTTFEIGACNNVQVLFQVFGGYRFGVRACVRYFLSLRGGSEAQGCCDQDLSHEPNIGESDYIPSSLSSSQRSSLSSSSWLTSPMRMDSCCNWSNGMAPLFNFSVTSIFSRVSCAMSRSSSSNSRFSLYVNWRLAEAVWVGAGIATSGSLPSASAVSWSFSQSRYCE